MKRFLTPRITLFFVLGLAVLTALNIAFRRYYFERHNNRVQISLSNEEVSQLALVGGMERSKLLSLLRKQSGVTSIIIEETTLESLLDSGKITVLKGSEIRNMLRVGQVYRYHLTHLSKLTLDMDKFYIVVDEAALFDRIRTYLKLELGIQHVKDMGWNILEATTNRESLMAVGLGFSAKEIKDYVGYGFNVIPRIKPSHTVSSALIKLKFDTFSSIPSVTTLLFSGKTIFGYPSGLSQMAKLVKENQMSIGKVEFFTQIGLQELTATLPKSLVRVHGMSAPQSKSMNSQAILERYVRAVKERGVRNIVVHPYLSYTGEPDIIRLNLDLLTRLSTEISSLGYYVSAATPTTPSRYIPAQTWELFVLSLGVGAAIILLMSHVTFLTFIRVGIGLLGIAVLFYIAILSNSLHHWNRVMALIVSIVFPCYAVVSQFPASELTKRTRHRGADALVFLSSIVGITLLGALFIVGFLSSRFYLFGVDHFYGVKLSIIIPLILLGIYFYLQPHRIRSMYFVFKRLFHQPISTSSLLAVLVCIMLVVLYILRSGNFVSFSVPIFETWLRNFLESTLTIRPRTKEILIGYPFLVLSYLLVDRYIPRHWLWFFIVLGSIALLSVTNSFCHLYTPLTVSLYRTLLGIGIGLFIGVLYLGVFRLALRIVRRINR